MRDDSPIGIDDRALDDAALEALAEMHAARAPASLRSRILAEAKAGAAGARAGRALVRWRIVGSIAAAAALVLAGQARTRVPDRRGTRRADRRPRPNQRRADDAPGPARPDVGFPAKRGRLPGARAARARRDAHAQRRVGATRRGGRQRPGARRCGVGRGGGGARRSGAERGGQDLRAVGYPWKQPPEPAGLFRVGAEATLAARVDRVPNPEQVTAFAVSIEPASGSPAPTGPVVLLGAVAG